MKRQILTLLLAFSALSFVNSEYYIRVNGTTDYLAEAFADADLQGRSQYRALNVWLLKDDVVSMYDSGSGSEWVIPNLDPYGEYQNFTYSSSGYKCKAEGCYDFYIKLKMNDDMLYIGKGVECGSDTIETTYTIAGNDSIVNGDAWNPNNADNLMTLNSNGVYTLTVKDLKLVKGVYEYKVVKNHNWATCFPAGDNAVLTVSKEATYTIEYSYKVGDASPSAVVTNQDTGEEEKPAKPIYSSAVPSQCGDVMLQGFYWDSYSDDNKTYKNTRWVTLLSQAAELREYFDLIWLPPSAMASGTGYIPSNYSNQSSAWGQYAILKRLIEQLHDGGTKVVADIVVNHVGNKSTKCDFYSYDFTPYGTFTPDATWLTKNESVNCASAANSNYDDGYGDDADYEAARDWDHNNAKVRDMCRAYLKWMYNEVGYDGWRYDYCKGFHSSHINDYNKASGAYFSVMEYWDANLSTIRSRLQEANWNTLTFDFATKYEILRDGIEAGNYQNLKGKGMLGAGLGKYAVTFVDSHDSFLRDGNEMYGKGNSMNGTPTSGNMNGVLQANAYILSMPGVPCVFYPHWYALKDYIAPMITARHATGVHSESAVSDQAGNGYYKAYITGTKGTIYLALGPNSNWGSAPDGYVKAVAINNIGVYYKLNSGSVPTLTVSPESSMFSDKEKGITVTMKASGQGGTPTIYYTTNGQMPTTTSSVYTEPLNFKVTTTLKAMAVLNGVSSAVQSHTYTYRDPQAGPIKVKFYNTAGWSKVYLWAWTSEGDLFGTWPGLELKDPDGDKWYEYTFDSKYMAVNLLFTCGVDDNCKTQDLYADGDVCYRWNNGSAVQADCKTDLAPANAAAALQVYPNPTRDVLNIKSDDTISEVEVYSLTGQLMTAKNGGAAQVQLNVESLAKGMYLLRVYHENGLQTTTNFIRK